MSDFITEEIDRKLERGRELLQHLNLRSGRCLTGKSHVWQGQQVKLDLSEVYLFHITEITFEEKAPRKEAMENILGTFRGMDGISFVYLILGDAEGVNFYLGVVRDKSYNGKQLFSVSDLGIGILQPSILGNFRGCKLHAVSSVEKNQIIKKLEDGWSVGMLEGVPGVDEKNEDFQGTDRLIDVMSGDEFGLAVIARPYTDAEVDIVERQLYAVSDALMPLAKYTMQRSQGSAKNENTNISLGKSEQATQSVQMTKSESYTVNDNDSKDNRRDESNQIQSTTNNAASNQWSISKNFSKSQADSETEGSGNSSRKERRQDASENAANGNNENCSIQKQSNYSYNTSTSKGENISLSHSESHFAGTSNADSNSSAITKNSSQLTGTSLSDNQSLNEQMEVEIKSAADWLKYMDEVLFPRLDDGRGKGIFLSCTYLFGRTKATLYRLANTAISLYSGSKGNKSALFFSELNNNADHGCLHALQNLQIPAVVQEKTLLENVSTVLSRCASGKSSFCGSWLSANELGLLAGFPQREVIGLRLREEVAFGLNTEAVPKEARIPLGKLVQCGIEKNEVYLNKKDLDKHTFIAGVTGSGKTTTCQNILLDCQLPFLVIEPAKTEYRILKESCPNLLFFTPGRQDIAPFFLNPFELFPGEAITSRADMIKAALEAAFDMEAAIPQIMEAAIYRAYKNKGWSIGTNLWNGKGSNDKNGPFSDGVYAFPTLSDFATAVKEVTEEQGFDDRLKNDYLGSINARIQSLMVGAKGQMLNTGRSLDFYDLVNRQVVIELEEIKNGAEKALLMGFILTNLLQAVKKHHTENKNFQHITLVEEAHRLLSKYMPGDSLNKKHGVEVFSDMLAEVRKYGESLIIVDQIPDKMTPEVLKNTNTKIVHKIFAQDDKDAIGNTMALKEEQKAFLSNLVPGRAVMFSQGWSKAIQIQVSQKSRTDQAEIGAKEIEHIALQYYLESATIKRGVLKGLEQFETVTKEDIKAYLLLLRSGSEWLQVYQNGIKRGAFAGREDQFKVFVRGLRQAVQSLDKELVFRYIYWNTYTEWDEIRGRVLKECIDEVVQRNDVKPGIFDRKIDDLGLDNEGSN